MIPAYTGPLTFHVGPLTFQLFGTLVVTGIFIGHALVLKLARDRGIPENEMRAVAAWAVGAGFVGAHLVDVLFYHPDKITRDGPVALLMIWDGISSFGGFFGALAGVAFYFWRIGKPWWMHADILIQGLVFGWVFGRLGCTLTSDHPGRLSHFLLAFWYPAGARHNLGFYELLYTVAVLVPCVLLLRAREKAHGYTPGIYVAAVAGLYAPARFLLDFLRATDVEHADPRWYGLTAAQYFSPFVFMLALWLMRRIATTAPERRAG